MKFLQTLLGSALAHTLVFATIFAGAAIAAELTTTPDSIQNADESRLRVSISQSATTITLEPVKKWVNGVRTSGCINTSKGFAVIEDGNIYEYISFGTNSCNSTTNVTTLTDVRRGLSPTTASFAAGTGLSWDAGASFRVIDYTIIYNQMMKKDLANVCTASGCISFSGSGSLVQYVYANATARTQQIGSNPREGLMSCLSDTGQCYDFMAGAHRSRSGSNIINATLLIAGKVQIANTGAILAATAAGSTGAENVLSARYTTASGGLSGVKKIGYVAVTEDTGFLSGALLGQGPTATKFLRGDMTYATPLTQSGVNLFVTKNVDAKIAGLGSTTFVAIDGSNLTTSVTGLSVGDLLMLNFRGTVTRTSGDPLKLVVDFQVGNNPMSPNGSGALTYVFASGTSQDQENMSFTRTIRMATGGTVTIQPIYRNYGGGTGFRFNENTSFDVIKVE